MSNISQSFPAFSLSKILWWTPNLCCSSITTKPILSKETFSWNSAWVPIKISALKLWFSFVEDVIKEHVKSIELMIFAIVLKCCSASISVGAISIDLFSFSKHCIIANNATIVLPLPTSPCKSLSILFGFDWSWDISSIVFNWSLVRLKSRFSSNRFISLLFLFIGTPWVWLILFFIRRIVNCWANSSSKTNLSKKRELTESDVLTGLCIFLMASFQFGQLFPFILSSGIHSGRGSRLINAEFIDFCIVFEVNPAVSG